MNNWYTPQRLLQSTLDLLLPPACVSCKNGGAWLCQACCQKIPRVDLPICRQCGTPFAGNDADCPQCKKKPLVYIDGIRSAAYFEDNPLRAAIHAFKYQDRKVVASLLADLLAEAYHRFKLQVDLIIPVPLHKTRLKKRGYNQSELLAVELGRLIRRPVTAGVLVRTRQTASQMKLTAEERYQNVKEAFECRERIDGQRLLLIDDVCTTGSTLDYCAMPLKANGANLVWGLTLAKAR